MLLLLPLLALSTIAFAQGPAQPCASFWDGVTPGDDSTRDADCYVYPDMPQIIGTVSYTFAYETAWAAQPDTQTILDNLATVVHNAMLVTVPAYETLQDNIPNIVFILTTISLADEAADTTRPTPDGPCQIQMSSAWWEQPGVAADDIRMQTIAHEVYHCVQSEFFGDAFNTEPDNWLLESSAEYFSNVAFPKVNDEDETAVNYKADVPLFGQDLYAPNIFFQSMEPAYGPVGINNWVRQSTLTPNTGAERTRLASLGNFPEDFHSFGRQYSSDSIRDTSGSLVPPFPHTVIPIPFAPPAGVTSISLPITASTFTVNVYSFDLDAGQTVSIAYSSTSSNVCMSYQLGGGNTGWIDMPSGTSTTGAEGVIVAQCNGPDESVESVTVMLLLTSTDDSDSVDVDVTVTQTATDPSCRCPDGSAKSGLSQCPNNNTLPPSPGNTTTTPPPMNGTGCSAAPGQPTSDPCLQGKTWTLDNAALEALMRSKLNIPAVTINSLSISGTGQFTITNTNATFTYTNYEVDVDISTAGLDVPTKTVINGAFEANFYIQNTGVFCLDVYAGQGSAAETDPFTGGFNFDLGPNGGFVEANYRIDYTCSAGSLTMQMTMGTQSWGPYVYSS